MKQQFRRTALASLVMLMSATALVACGGGDDPAPPPAAPGGGTGGGTGVTITPTSNSANDATGAINGSAFIDTTGGTTYTGGTVTYASSTVSTTGTIALGGTPTYGGLLIASQLAAATFNASSYTTLKIQLKSTTDTTIRVRLQPGTQNNTGCLPSKALTVTSTLTEYTIPLDTTNFTQAFTCTYRADSDLASIKPAMGQVEVINESLAAGSHDVTVGTIKFQ